MADLPPKEKPTSVFEITRDLVETTQQEDEQGVDWNWGENTATEEYALTRKIHDEDEEGDDDDDDDSDATAGMSDDESSADKEEVEEMGADADPTANREKPDMGDMANKGASDVDDDCMELDGTKESGSADETTVTKLQDAEIRDEGATEDSVVGKSKHDEVEDDDDSTPSELEVASKAQDSDVSDETADMDNESVEHDGMEDSSSEIQDEDILYEEEGPNTEKETFVTEAAADKVVEDENNETPDVEEVDKDDDSLKASAAKPKKTKKTKQPDEEDLIRSTDFLFLQADKDSVTVADICRALEAEYDCKLSKATRKVIRGHLVDLMTGEVPPSVQGEEPTKEEAEPSDEGNVSDQGDDESEASGYEEDPKHNDKAKARRKGRKSKVSKEKKPKDIRTKRPNAQKAAKATRMVEAERLRKKRMEELRIRNEEMQLNQSKEDQERAEAIAAKFETNTDELRIKRLEDRLDLLQRLDQKRISVVDLAAKYVAAVHEQQPEKNVQEPEQEESEDDEESSSDEEDLEIVGASKPIKPLAPLHTHLPSKALSVLDNFRSPEKLKQRKTGFVASPSRRHSPTKNIGMRHALRQALKQKLRKAGNLWLARELGYKTEEDHLKDCQTVATQKREQILKLEQERLKANERKLLRERLLLQEGEPEEDAKAEVPTFENPGDEDDEDLQLAKEIEKEAKHVSIEVYKAKESNILVPIGPSLLNSENCHKSMNNDCGSEESLSCKVNVTDEEAGVTTEESQISLPFDDFENLETQPPVDVPAFPRGMFPRFVSDDRSSDQINQGAAGNPATLSTEDSSGQDDASTTMQVGGDNAVKDSEADDVEEEELEFIDEKENAPTAKTDSNRPRNAGWQAILKREAEMLKKMKKRKGDLVEDQAEEEEEEEVAGLEDFGFSVKKKQDDEEENPDDYKVDADDLEHVVDDVSDGEGDEEAGEVARKRLEQREEKERHKEILRRMREGYDGRRGGIAGGGSGARGIHRFDQLVAADNREDAKRLGLLNDDEIDSDEENKDEGTNGVEEEDEAALLDRMLKNRFLHRSDIEIEENFSEDEEAEDDHPDQKERENDSDEEEERAQERLAKRFAKRARMQRLEEIYVDSQEFSQQRLIDEDETMRLELSQMKNGLVRASSISTSRSLLSSLDSGSRLGLSRQRSTGGFGGSFLEKSGSLSVALRASRKTQRRSSFVGGEKAGDAKETSALIHKNVSLGHVFFTSQTASRASFSNSSKSVSTGKRKQPDPPARFFPVGAGNGQYIIS